MAGDAGDVLALLEDPEEDVPRARPRGRPRKRPRDDDLDQDAGAVLALIGEADPLPRPRRQRAARLLQGLRRRRATRATKVAKSKALHFNQSGKACTRDDQMVVGSLAKVRGSGQWRMWTPEARLRAGFATASLKETASQFAEGAGDAAERGRAKSSVHYNKNLVASVIEDGTTRGVTRLQERSLEDPLAFWINTSMFDETKLWYRLRRGGIRNWSTLAWHTVVTWRGSHGGVRDEDIVRALLV